MKPFDAVHCEVVAELYKQHSRLLLDAVRPIVKSMHAAEDVVEQAFEIVLALPNPSRVRRLDGYLYEVGYNLAKKEWRRRKKVVSSDGSTEIGPGSEVARDPTPEDALIVREDLAAALCGIDKLPFRRHLIMRLKCYAAKSTREIVDWCRELGFRIDERTVQREIQRAIADLRQETGIVDGDIKEQRK